MTLVQLYAIGPIGGKVPIIMGTSSGFIGVCRSVATSMGGGILGYAAIMGASIVGGIFEGILGIFLKPLRRFFPAMVTGTVVLSIGLSLISVGVASFAGGSSAADYGSLENLCIGLAVIGHHPGPQARHQGPGQLLLHPDRHHLRLCDLRRAGVVPAHHRRHRRRRGVHQGLGAELVPGEGSFLVLDAPDHACHPCV